MTLDLYLTQSNMMGGVLCFRLDNLFFLGGLISQGFVQDPIVKNLKESEELQ